MPLYSSQDLIHGIVQECHSQFKRLPRHGKPLKRSNGQSEWTILAGIVLATPAPTNGSTGHDDGVDTEVGITDRRGAVSWEIECGDATTASLALAQTEESRKAFLNGRDTNARAQEKHVAQTLDQNLQGAGSKHQRETTENEDACPLSKQPRTEPPSPPGSHRVHSGTSSTSACDHVLGLRRGRVDYDSVGVLRTKPGRVDSEPTTSMSCSDKIARWNILGLCSALVAPFLQPIYLHSIITRELFDLAALRRSLYERIDQCHCFPALDESSQMSRRYYRPHPIEIHESSVPFEFSKEVVTIQAGEDGTTSPPVASSSTSEPSKPEVLANGCKAGASAKQPIQPKAQSQLCKTNMFKTSVNLWKSLPESTLSKLDQCDTLRRVLSPPESESNTGADGTTYGEWKRLAIDYNAAKERLLNGVFRNWIKGDDALERFNIHGDHPSK
ncbi:tRNA-specific adenosine deaminase 1 [Mortierella sp. NVP85]|nr:tRNA-specific adenosine deaminase 1 [Mortierella sp. NVP85]